MKIVITGASGFVGCRMQRFLGLSHEVVALSSKDLDITDDEKVLDTLMTHAPKVVVHLAAVADTRYCEANPEDSAVINIQGAVNVARAAAAVGAKLVFASSEQVYNALPDGAPHRETFDLQPKSVYGRHKLQAEQDILDIAPSAVGLRLTWMYDLPASPLPQKSGLLVNLCKADRECEVLRCSTRERRGITNVWEVVRRVEATFALPGGVYNFGSPNDLSTFDIHLAAARKLWELNQISTVPASLVLPDETWTRNLALDLSRLQAFGITFPSTLTGLHNALCHSTAHKKV